MNFETFMVLVTTKVTWADAVEDDDNYPMPPLIFRDDNKLCDKHKLSRVHKRPICHASLSRPKKIM